MSNIMILPNISYDDTFEVCAEVFCLYAKQKNISFSKGEDGISLIADDALCSEQSKVEAKDRKILVYASTVKGMHIALAKILGNLTEKNGCVYREAVSWPQRRPSKRGNCPGRLMFAGCSES